MQKPKAQRQLTINERDNNSPCFQGPSISRHFEPCHFQWPWPAWPHPSSAAQDQTHQASSPGQLSTGGGDVAPGNCHWAMSCAVDVLVPFGLYQGMVKQPKNIPREWNPRKNYSIFYNILYRKTMCKYYVIYFWLTYNFWWTKNPVGVTGCPRWCRSSTHWWGHPPLLAASEGHRPGGCHRKQRGASRWSLRGHGKWSLTSMIYRWHRWFTCSKWWFSMNIIALLLSYQRVVKFWYLLGSIYKPLCSMLDSLLRWQLQWDDFYVVRMDDVWCSIDGVAVPHRIMVGVCAPFSCIHSFWVLYIGASFLIHVWEHLEHLQNPRSIATKMIYN